MSIFDTGRVLAAPALCAPLDLSQRSPAPPGPICELHRTSGAPTAVLSSPDRLERCPRVRCQVSLLNDVVIRVGCPIEQADQASRLQSSLPVGPAVPGQLQESQRSQEGHRLTLGVEGGGWNLWDSPGGAPWASAAAIRSRRNNRQKKKTEIHWSKKYKTVCSYSIDSRRFRRRETACCGFIFDISAPWDC